MRNKALKVQHNGGHCFLYCFGILTESFEYNLSTCFMSTENGPCSWSCPQLMGTLYLLPAETVPVSTQDDRMLVRSSLKVWLDTGGVEKRERSTHGK